MELFVLIGIVVAVIGVGLALRGRAGNTTGGLTNQPDARPDHPEDAAGREQLLDDHGTR